VSLLKNIVLSVTVSGKITVNRCSTLSSADLRSTDFGGNSFAKDTENFFREKQHRKKIGKK